MMASMSKPKRQGPGAAPDAIETALHGDELALQTRANLVAVIRRNLAMQMEDLRLRKLVNLAKPDDPISGLAAEHVAQLELLTVNEAASPETKLEAIQTLRLTGGAKTFKQRMNELEDGYKELRKGSDEGVWALATTMVEDPNWEPLTQA
jgi:hypothetical protein